MSNWSSGKKIIPPRCLFLFSWVLKSKKRGGWYIDHRHERVRDAFRIKKEKKIQTIVKKVGGGNPQTQIKIGN